MKKNNQNDMEFIEAGQITAPHGIKGEVRVYPWCDSAEMLLPAKAFLIGGKIYPVLSSRVHKGSLVCQLEGITDRNGAEALRGSVIEVQKDTIPLPPGRVWISDLIGLPVYADTEEIGILQEVLTEPANDVYRIVGKHEYLIPAVPAFIHEINLEEGQIMVELIEGMQIDAD